LRERKEEAEKVRHYRADLRAGIVAAEIWNLAITCKWVKRRGGGLFSPQDFIPRPQQQRTEKQNQAAIEYQIAGWKALAKRKK
jgi:hypothetical protein